MDTVFLRFSIGKQEVDLPEDLSLSISYNLEDTDDFQTKGSSIVLDVSLPASARNSRVFNSFHNPDITDLSTGEKFRDLYPCTIVVGGNELLNGVAQLRAGSHTDQPEEYTISCYGNNGDWVARMKELTLHDCLSTNVHLYTQAVIEGSWNFDGTNENADYVYAPVRYRKPFSNNDNDVQVTDMRPSISVYWLIQRAFRQYGYRVQSGFFNSNYFKRMVLPWVWGDFLNLNSKVSEMLKFKAAGDYTGLSSDRWSKVLNSLGNSHSSSGKVDSSGNGAGFGSNNFTMNNDFKNGMFDNGDNFFYHDSGAYNGAMEWRYPASIANQLGTITAKFSLRVNCGIQVSFNSHATIRADIYKSGVRIQNTVLLTLQAGFNNPQISAIPAILNFDVTGLTSGDNVVVYLTYEYFKSFTGSVTIEVFGSLSGATTSLELTGVLIEPGGVVNFKQYEKFKDYKFLDLLRGIVDAFDIQVQTDSTAKSVIFEPAHSYKPDSVNTAEGYFTNKRLDWTGKQDVSQPSVVQSYSDAEREQLFRFKEDSSDGGINKYNLRHSIEAGTSKYVFPGRFKEGKKEFSNRFFGPVVHYNANQWKSINGVAPQLIAMIPENVANTSANEGETAFIPKLAWYKGLVDKTVFGAWSWHGDQTKNLPFMFAVNYKSGGINDPVLTYNDQNINGQLAPGLMRRFFLQRLAIMRNGKLYESYFDLTDKDVTNWYHREKILIRNAAYLLVAIDGYNPINHGSTKCRMWQFWPIEQRDITNSYPSQNSVINQPATVTGDDMKYQQLLLIPTDIPK